MQLGREANSPDDEVLMSLPSSRLHMIRGFGFPSARQDSVTFSYSLTVTLVSPFKVRSSKNGGTRTNKKLIEIHFFDETSRICIH